MDMNRQQVYAQPPGPQFMMPGMVALTPEMAQVGFERGLELAIGLRQSVGTYSIPSGPELNPPTRAHF